MHRSAPALSLLVLVLAAMRGANAQHLHPVSDPAPGELFTNLGTHHYAVSHRVPQSQRYFDQGLRLTYAFNHEAAIESFALGAKLDSACAMCEWGIALALGPNINMPMDSAAEERAVGAIADAGARSKFASDRERALIAALSTRYALPAGAQRGARDSAYARAMQQLSTRYPRDLEIATLSADAMINLRPWDQWTADGHAQPGTDTLVATLERVLRAAPDHPGACHFYIHAVEASNTPERALPCAERLPRLMPGAGHIVHMPAHIYLRVGRYADAVRVNEHAAEQDHAYLEGRQPVGVYSFYYAHNLHFLWAAASMEGSSAIARDAAGQLAGRITPEMVRKFPFLEYQLPTRVLTFVRFGGWDEVLAEPTPPADMKYTRGVWHFARGMAMLRTRRAAAARAERDTLAAIRDSTSAEQMFGMHSAKKLLTIALGVLDGEAAAAHGAFDSAATSLREAVRLEDSLVYDEPPPWFAPVRQTLGAILLDAGRPADAEAVYRDDLRRHPHNGWSLFGLAASLRAQGRTGDAARADAEFARAWADADVTLSSSRF